MNGDEKPKYCDFCGTPPSTETVNCAPPFKVRPHEWTGKHPADKLAGRVTEIVLAPAGAYERAYEGATQCDRMAAAMADIVAHMGWLKVVRYSMAVHQTGATFKTFREAIGLDGISGYPVAAWYALLAGEPQDEDSAPVDLREMVR